MYIACRARRIYLDFGDNIDHSLSNHSSAILIPTAVHSLRFARVYVLLHAARAGVAACPLLILSWIWGATRCMCVFNRR